MQKKSKFSTFPNLILVGVISLCCLQGCGEPTDLDAEFAIATEALENKNYPVMSAALKKLLRAEPENAEARFLLSKAEIHLSRGVASEVQLRKALNFGLEPYRAAPWLLKAWMFQKKFDEVIVSEAPGQIAADFAQHEPDLTAQAEMKGIIGLALLSTGKLEDAKEYFDAAIELSPNAGYALVGLAQLSLKNKDVDTAKAQLVDAVERAPEHAPGWSLLGDAHLHSKNTSAALEAYSNAVNLRPRNPEDRVSRALVLAQLGDFAKAKEDAKFLSNIGFSIPQGQYIEGIVAYFEKSLLKSKTHMQAVLAKEKDFLAASCLLGALHAQTGEYVQAESEFERCRNQGRANSGAHRIYASVLAVNGKPALAKQTLESIIAVNPNDLEALARLAELELSEQNTERAIELLNQVLVENDENIAANFQIGRALFQQNDAVRGQAAFTKARTLNPDERTAILVEVAEHIREGRLKNAMDALAGATQQWPNDPQLLNLLAITHANLGETTEAEKYFKQILDIEPLHISAATNLAKIYIESERRPAGEKLLIPLVEKYPFAHKALGMLLLLNVENRQFETAEEIFSSAEKANVPPSLEFRSIKIKYLKSIDRNEDALVEVKKLLTENEEDPVWLREKGKLELALGRHQQAIDSLLRAVALDAKNPFGYMILAQAYRQSAQIENAHQTIKNVLEIAPHYHPALITELRLLLSLGEAGAARARFNNLIAVSPNRKLPILIDLEAQLLSLEGKEQQAYRLVQEAFYLAPSPDRAWALSLAKDLPIPLTEVARLFRDYLEGSPQDAAIRFVYADTLARTGAVDEAHDQYLQLIKRSPNNPLLLNNMAELLRTADPILALEYATQAMAGAPDSPNILDTYGLFMLADGKLDKAREVIIKAANKVPRNSLIAYHALQVEVAAGNYENAKSWSDKIDVSALKSEDQEEFKRIRDTLEKIK